MGHTKCGQVIGMLVGYLAKCTRYTQILDTHKISIHTKSSYTQSHVLAHHYDPIHDHHQPIMHSMRKQHGSWQQHSGKLMAYSNGLPLQQPSTHPPCMMLTRREGVLGVLGGRTQWQRHVLTLHSMHSVLRYGGWGKDASLETCERWVCLLVLHLATCPYLPISPLPHAPTPTTLSLPHSHHSPLPHSHHPHTGVECTNTRSGTFLYCSVQGGPSS